MENADKALPELYIELFGQKKKLVANFLTLCRFEMRSGKNCFNQRTWLNLSMTDLLTFVWAALGGDSSDHSFEDVATEMSEKNVPEIHALVMKLIERVQWEDKEKKTRAVNPTP